MSNAFSQTWDYWCAGGPLLIPIALVCFGIWAYFLKTRRRLLEVVRTRKGFEDDLLQNLSSPVSLEEKTRQYMSAPGVLPQAVAYALDAAQQGGNANQAFEEYQQNTLAGLNRDFVVLAALTAVAPLLGLLGTVAGMIETFQAVAASTGKTAGKMAGGISQALITTQFGLVVAIPGVFGLARLHRIIDHVKVRFSICKSHLLMALEKRNDQGIS